MSDEPIDFATVAVLLADPIRRAWREHLDTHPGTCPTAGWGIVHCPTAMAIFDCLPRGDQLNILGSVA